MMLEMTKHIPTKISPEAYLRLREVIAEMEGLGYTAYAASRAAQTAIGLYPPAAREIIVDYSMRGAVYPFMG